MGSAEGTANKSAPSVNHDAATTEGADGGGRSGDGRPVVVLSPEPQSAARIITPDTRQALEQEFELIDLEGQPESVLDEHLPRAFAIVGQPNLTQERLRAAPNLRAVLNVEGNFLPNVDYPTAFDQGIRVLGCGPAYAQAVAEYSLGLALDLARGISREDRAFREGREQYVSASTQDSILLQRAPVGLVGFGNLGRALLRLLRPFDNDIRVYDPWLPESVLRAEGMTPVSLDETVSTSRFLFVLATATGESTHLLGDEQMRRAPDQARWVLVSRAPVVDYDALRTHIATGKILAGIDVWPEEPAPADEPLRNATGTVLSAHRAGGIAQAFESIGEMVLDDLRLMARGLPPVRMQVAAPELVGRYRNRPVG